MRRIIETSSLFVLIVLVALRPLIGESYDSAGNTLTRALSSIADPTPLRTLVFDLLILLAAAGSFLSRAIGRGRHYRPTGLEWGYALLIIAAVVSCFFAGNKRLAVNATIDWLCYPLLAIALTQLMTTGWHRRLLLSAILASATVQSFQCFEQYFVSFDETWAHYESIKDDFWAAQDVELDSARVAAFERRIKAREAAGFMPHANVTGSYLILCGLAAIGLSLSRRRSLKRGQSFLPALGATVVTLFVLVAMVLTNSLGALVAGGVGIVLWIAVARLRPWISANHVKALTLGWIAVAMVGLAVVGHGLYHHRLPGWSLTFRWHYWSGAGRMIADHPLTGVGRENFGRHYLQYKTIESAEEVANPHNLFVQAATDWGVIGLVGLVLMLVGGSVVLFGRRTHQSSDHSGEVRTESPPRRLPLVLWMLALLTTLLLARISLLGTDDPNFIYYATMTAGVFWACGFAVFFFGREAGMANPPDQRLVVGGAAIGLFAFLLHDMINFAAFVPASATTLFALFAYCVSTRANDETSSSFPGAADFSPRESTDEDGSRAANRMKSRLVGSLRESTLPSDTPARPSALARWLPVSCLTAAIVVVVAIGITPVARAQLLTSRALLAGRTKPIGPLSNQLALVTFGDAVAADPLDPTPCVKRAEWLLAVATLPEYRDEAFGLAENSLEEAIERDPFNARFRRLEMQLHVRRADHTGQLTDRLSAVDAARKALELYPENPAGLVTLADRQSEAATATTDATSRADRAAAHKLLEEALSNYQQALDLDAARPAWAKLAAFSTGELETIKAKVRRANQALDQADR